VLPNKADRKEAKVMAIPNTLDTVSARPAAACGARHLGHGLCLLLVVLLQGCTVIGWIFGSRDDGPLPAPASAPVAATPIAPPPVTDAPAPRETQPIPPIISAATPAPEATRPAPVIIQASPQVEAPASPTRAAALPDPAPAAPAPARSRASAPTGAPSTGRATAARRDDPSGTLPAARYAVQVGAYRIEASAHKVRDEIAAQLIRADAFSPSERRVRVVAYGDLFRVLVGEAERWATAAALAQRVRDVIQAEAFVMRP
jgi:hypothetical protein